MSCPDAASLAAYAEGKLGPEEDTRLSRHVRSCAECTRALRDFASRAVTAVARTLVVSNPPASGAPAAIPERGTSIGRYLVLGVVGEGGMGLVLSAYDPQLNRRVALKLLRVELDSTDLAEALRERLRREAQTMARLSHPNVVAVYDVGPYGQGIYVAMEWVEGSDLWRWQSGPQRPAHEVLALYLAAGEGLAAAHRSGIVHRDFKPDNVLVGADGRVRVTDFGLARQARRSKDERELTGPGAVVGTPGYIAPEQLRGTEVDGRADQFSFCAALYESLYGRAAFAGGSDPAVLARSVLDGKLREPPSAAHVARYLWPVLHKGLSPDPAQRYPMMEALLEALRDDPKARYRRWAAAALGLIAVLGTLSGVRALVIRDRSRCQTAARAQLSFWSPERRARMDGQVSAKGDARATADWRLAAGRIDSYSQTWIEARAGVCEAERASGDSADLARQDGLRREEVCLTDLRRDFMQALSSLESGEFVAPTGSRPADRATLVSRLDPPETCQTSRTLALTGADSDEGLWDRLARARVNYFEDHFQQATPLLDQLIVDARGKGARLILARALLTKVDLDRRSGADSGQIQADLEEATWAAEAAGDDPLVAELRLRQVDQASIDPPPAGERAAWLAKLATLRAEGAAAVHRAGDTLLLRAIERWSAGNVDVELGNTATGLAELEVGLSLSRQVKGATITTSAILNDLAAAYEEAGDYRQSESDFREGLRLDQEVLGTDAVDSAQLEVNLGWVEVLQQRPLEALPLMEHGVKVFSEIHDSASNSYYGWVLLNLGQTLLALGRVDEAWGQIEEARSIYEREDNPDPADMSSLRTTRGQVELARGQLPGAAADLERALADLSQHRGLRRELAETEFALAQVLAAQGHDLPRARALAESAHQRFAAASVGDRVPLDQVEAWQRGHSAP